MGEINIGTHTIKTDEYGEVICPWDGGEPPRGWKHRVFLSTDATYMCKDGHLHKVSEFSKTVTNEVDPQQIRRRG